MIIGYLYRFQNQDQEKAMGKRQDRAGKPRHRIKSGRRQPAARPSRHGNEWNGPVRLNRYIAHTGLCSRREADEMIAAGLISVNGKTVTELGMKVSPGDKVSYNGRLLENEDKVYILMNKPKDYITTLKDPHAGRTVMDLIGDRCAARVYPVGRLDRATTGVLLLTNDGDLTRKLTHPGFNKKKIYHVFLDKSLKEKDRLAILRGMKVGEDYIHPGALDYVDPADKTQVGIEIHTGQNRIIRRTFESLGYRIRKLDRVYFAGLTKKGLRRGQWRFLSEREISVLKMMSFD
jgi:23S rRNA pseudouridine2605 synthase